MTLSSLARRPRPIGALRRRMLLEEPADVDDGAGGVTRLYQTRDSVWAALETVAAHPAIADNRGGARLTHRITLRWRADIDVDKRFRLGSRIFWVRSVADADAHRRHLAVMVEEEAP